MSRETSPTFGEGDASAEAGTKASKRETTISELSHEGNERDVCIS